MLGLLFGTLGAFASRALGGSLALGYFFGGAVASIFRRPRARSAPSLDEFGIQRSEYGLPIVQAYGTPRAPGNVIWFGQVQKVPIYAKTENGFGVFSFLLGERKEVIGWRYYATWASSICAAPPAGIGGIDRIWLDGDLVFDTSAEADAATLEKSQAWIADGTIKLYLGGAEQPADPIHQEIEGGTVPAYRDQAYIRFHKWELSKHGNRVPNVEARVIAAGQADGAPLSDIVTDICGQVGIEAADLDVSDLTDTVAGYAIRQQGPARNALQPLMLAYHVDIAQDDVMRFLKRGERTVITGAVAETDLGAFEAGTAPPESLELTYEAERSMPRTVNVHYLDTTRQGEVSTQTAGRELTVSEAVANVDLPILLTANQAARIARIELDQLWSARKAARLTLSSEFLYLLPGDVVRVPHKGFTHDLRFQQITIGANGLIEVAAMPADLEIYKAEAAGESGGGLLAGGAAAVRLYDCRGYMLDLPALRREHGEDIAAYLAATIDEADAADFAGADLHISRDGGATWTLSGLAVAPSVIGDCDSILENASPWRWDAKNTLHVTIRNGALASASETAVLNGANLAYVGEIGGAFELIQFQTAEAAGGNVYILSGLLRGRFGTEGATAGHGPGETFVLLEEPALARVRLETTDRGAGILYKLLGPGMEIADVTAQTFTLDNINLKPWAPVHLEAERHRNGTWEMKWIRRARYDGELSDAGVPLREKWERYIVQILDGEDVKREAELRRLPNADTQPHLYYRRGEQVEDFGAVQSSVRFRVAQISEAYGPGHWSDVAEGNA